MKSRKLVAACVLGIGGLACAGQAAAQAFVGGAIGGSDFDNDIAAGLIDSGEVDTSDTAFKAFGGYRFTPNFAMEGSAVHLGEAAYSGTFIDASGTPLDVTNGKVEVAGVNAAAVAILPVTPEFEVFGKLGLFLWEAEASDRTAGRRFEQSEDGADISFGVGLAYRFAPHLAARAEWEHFSLDEVDASLLTVGVEYRF